MNYKTTVMAPSNINLSPGGLKTSSEVLVAPKTSAQTLCLLWLRATHTHIAFTVKYLRKTSIELFIHQAICILCEQEEQIPGNRNFIAARETRTC